VRRPPEDLAVRIVILSPSTVFDDSLASDAEAGVAATVVGWASGPGGADIELPRPTGPLRRLASRVSASAIGRELVDVTPLAPSRAYWRAMRDDPAVAAAVEQADVIVATERDAAYAAWRWHDRLRRKGRHVAAVYGVPAARAAIERLRA